jgi:predicted negative regulator of RcsB-dependent stress response
MSLIRNQQGFTPLAFLLVAAILAVIGLAAYQVYSSQTQTPAENNNAASQHAPEEATVPEAPEIKSAEDLDKAEQTLDKINPEDSNADGAQLDQQTSDL